MKKTNLVFIIENNHFQEEQIHKVLDKDHRHEFVYFEHSKDCIDNLHRHPMAVFVDYDLKTIDKGEMDAISILDKIKELEHHTEVILFSAKDSAEVANDAAKHGAYDYIVQSEYKYLRFRNILSTLEKNFERAVRLKNAKRFNIIAVIIFVAYAILMFALWKSGVLDSRSGDLIEPW